MRRSLRLFVVVAAMVVAAGCGGAAPPPHFDAADGWHVLAEPGQFISAANVPFVTADRRDSAPTRTVASLPHTGIVIWVQAARRGKSPAQDRYYPSRSLPLRVQSMDAVQPEGFTCPPSSGSGCATRALQAAGERWNVAIFVFFGTAHPSRTTVAAANRELAQLQFA